jgi:hypothetical protein
METEAKIIDNIRNTKSVNHLPTPGPTQPLNPANYLIDLADEVPDPHPLVTANGVMTLSPQNISVQKGKQKSGKTFKNTIDLAAFFSGRCGAVTSQPLPNKSKAALIDTEQGTAHVHKVARRVHRLCGFDTTKNYSCFEVYACKDIDYKQRFELLKMVATDPQMGFIVVDGIVDMMLDFNDLAESTRVKDEILKLVKENDIHISFTIHTNKADNNSRGHIGAILEQKAEAVFSINKDGDYFEVSPAYCRNLPFEPFGFRIVEGLPVEADATDRPNPNHTKQQDIFRKIINGTSTINYKDLIQQYVDHSGLSEPTAKRHIALNYSNGFFEKNDTGSYWIKNNAND